MAVAGKRSQVNVSGEPVSFSQEPTTPNEDLTVFQITNPTKRVWDRNTAITVERSTDGGTTWKELDPDTDGYRLDRLFGQVEFENARNSGTEIRVSGEYLPMSKVAQAYEYSYSIEADNQDDSSFGDEFVSRKQGLKDFTGSISRFYQANSLFYDALNNDDVVVVEFYVDSSRPPDLKGWAIFSSDEDSSSVDGLVEESLEFEGTEDADERSVSVG